MSFQGNTAKLLVKATPLIWFPVTIRLSLISFSQSLFLVFLGDYCGTPSSRQNSHVNLALRTAQHRSPHVFWRNSLEIPHDMLVYQTTIAGKLENRANEFVFLRAFGKKIGAFHHISASHVVQPVALDSQWVENAQSDFECLGWI